MKMRSTRALLSLFAMFTILACSGEGWAQAKIARIGFLNPASGGVWPECVAAFRSMGYIEKMNIAFEVRTAESNLDRLPELAADLVRSKVDVIIAVSPPAILAAKRATSTIPIVMAFWGGEGLIESGVAASLARPGGNITGINMLASELEAKRFELLLETIPKAVKIAVLNSGNVLPELQSDQGKRARMVQLYVTDPPGTEGYDRAFDAMRKARVDAALIPSFPRFYFEHRRIIDAAAKYRVPAIYEWGEVARNGGLISYGADFAVLTRRVAAYVDRILRGAKPGDLPIEQPTKFELVVNLRTAKTLGLTIPQSILQRANEVIQ